MTKLEMTFNSLLINEIYKREKSVEVVFKQVNEEIFTASSFFIKEVSIGIKKSQQQGNLRKMDVLVAVGTT